MVDTLVEKKTCDGCGADVRPGSLFCYNCGGSVSLDLQDHPKASVQVSDAWLKGDLAADSDLKTTRLDAQSLATSDLEKTDSRKFQSAETGPVLPIEKPADVPGAKLKSAASMRRKPKSFQRKSTEIVWEEPEGGPNKWFPIVAVFLILLVVGIYYMAMYLR